MPTRPARLLVQVTCLLLAAAAPAGLSFALRPELQAAWRGERPVEEGAVTKAEVAVWSEAPLWVDARPAADFHAGTILDAVHLYEGSWDEGFANLLAAWQGQPIVVFCSDQGCGSSKQVARRLRDDLGFADIYFLSGGWETWNQP
jgi:rhodanese-related sulfurtransferase